ncbi:hypothetical protein GWI68_05770 [Proteus sp. G2669]|uniref:T6SS effector phospholipase Tle3 domain-containing protein n=1 Tax=Proteus sp. G2669 TaxID=2698881 RepID=UPI0014131A4B|nr:hypothetical protein [Proteus sp. G2669]NBM54307.1 hypothetical protein [Proteus sp. G2669]
MNNSDNKETTRWLKEKMCLDGSYYWQSCTNATNIGGEIHVKPNLPGIIILVHGVHSEGEWYSTAEENICNGLNERLNLINTPYELTANEYYQPTFLLDKNNIDDSHYTYEEPIRILKKRGNSPIIRFHWGYRSDDDKWDDYKIPLKNIAGESYHQLKNAIVNPEYSSADQNKWTLEDKEKYRIAEEYQSLSFKKRKIFIYEKLKDKGPFLWEGGPFQNGCNHLKSLWSEYGFSSWPKLWATIPFPAPFPIPVNIQAFNPETDTLLTSSPSRQYFAHAAGRLAKLIAQIRKNNKDDTVTVVSHSQGTMIALAACAIEAPDALFVLNSPYAIEDKTLNTFSYPLSENIDRDTRITTLKKIIDKIAENKNKLKNNKNNLIVGLTEQKKNWTPFNTEISRKINVETPSKKINSIKIENAGTVQERDNHGNTYIYCNPHDRVMGSSPLESIGWSAIPNITQHGQTQPHPIFSSCKTLFVRMLARNTPCGEKPDPQNGTFTVFTDKNGRFRDGYPFWDNKTAIIDSFVWPEPEKNMFLNINAPEVPTPIKDYEQKNFDVGFLDSDEPPKKFGGVIYKNNQYEPVTREYYYLKYLYSYENRILVELTDKEKNKLRKDPLATPNEKNVSKRYETMDEMRIRIRDYICRPNDHGTLPLNVHLLHRILAFDLPIGHCSQANNPEMMAELRRQADWLSNGGDEYVKTGKLDLPDIPEEISNPDLSKI